MYDDNLFNKLQKLSIGEDQRRKLSKDIELVFHKINSIDIVEQMEQAAILKRHFATIFAFDKDSEIEGTKLTRLFNPRSNTIELYKLFSIVPLLDRVRSMFSSKFRLEYIEDSRCELRVYWDT